MSVGSNSAKMHEDGGIATGLVDQQALAADLDPDVRAFSNLLAKIIARPVAKDAQRGYNAEESLESRAGVGRSEGQD